MKELYPFGVKMLQSARIVLGQKAKVIRHSSFLVAGGGEVITEASSTGFEESHRHILIPHFFWCMAYSRIGLHLGATYRSDPRAR